MKICWVAVIAIVVLVPIAAAPCWVCHVPKTPAEEWQRSPVIFVGTAIMANREVATFQVKEAIRGSVGKEEQMDQLLSTCRFPFQTGEAYLVYTSRSDKGYLNGASSCSRTAKVRDAEEDLKFLREQHTR